jgi:MSHA biogenesis protein MshN
MSLINKMLQDLDRRQALGTGPEAGVLRAAPTAARHREWFWRIVTLLLTVGVAWVLWIAYQILPRPLVTDAAFRAAERARARAPIAVKVQAPVVPAVAEVAPAAPVAPKQAEEPLPVKQPPAAEALKLALAIETPVREPAAKPAVPAPRPKAAPPAAAPAPAAAAPAPRVAAPVAAAETKTSVDKRERNAPTSAAEAHFRRAALLLSHGRVSEAEVELAAALKSDPGHVPARQAYVSLLLDQQRIAHARRLLEESLAENPAQPTFALALARVHAALRDYPKALEVLDRAGPAAGAPEFQAMRGAVLQRLGRDEDAVRAFEDAIRGAPQPAATWVSLGISLEALGRRPEAADAYRKALAAGPLALEAREYAQDRMRALQ